MTTLCALLAFSACAPTGEHADAQGSEGASLDRTSGRDSLELVRMIGDTAWWGLPVQLLVVEPWLIVADRRMPPAISVVDLESGSMVTRFGQAGPGPSEISYPGFVTLASLQPLSIRVYDVTNSRLAEFALDDLTNVRATRHVLQTANGAVRQLQPAPGGFIAGGSFSEATLLLLDSSATMIIDRIGEPPISPEQHLGPWVYHANRYFLTPHPSRDMVALAYLMQSRIAVYSFDGTLNWTSEGPLPAPPPTADTPPWRMVYRGLAATERFIYAIHIYDERSNHSNIRLGPSRVHVFTWSGEFVTELAVDRELTAIVVSPDDALLYGGVTEPFPLVAEWRLPEHLRAQ